MELYWPSAIVVYPDGSTRTISTYSPADTLKKADSQFQIWRDAYGYMLSRCWVDVYVRGEKVRTYEGEPLKHGRSDV